MIKPYHVIKAQQILQPYIQPSPLVYSPTLSQRTGAEVWLKLESRQPTGSFKIRGALYKMIALGDTAIVTASAGNHGLGVAYAAQQLGYGNVTVFVPETTPSPKLRQLAQFPITLKQVGQSYNDAHHSAESFAQTQGATYLSAYDDIEVITGAGTVGLEILQQRPTVDTVMVPVGGGGLIAGVSVALKGIHREVEIIGLQPTASPSAKISFEQNLPAEDYEAEPTIADGLAGGFGRFPFYLSRTLIDQIMLFSEAELRQAVFTLVDQSQLIVEASGAISIAPLLHENHPWTGRTVVCILTGANIETALLAQILQEGSGSFE